MKRLPPNDSIGVRERDGAFAIDRRGALKLFSAGLALSLAGCGRPHEEIVPYVDMPEGLVPGVARKYATTLALNGYGRGVLATSIDGRPIKIEGNPRHPASLGATDVFAEAAIMSLYDPNRLRAPLRGNDISAWEAFTSALRPRLERAAARGGAGLGFLSGRVASPTLERQIGDIRKQFPQARWYRYEPVSDDNVRAGTRLAFGRPLMPRPRLRDAAVVLALDADPLGPGPEQIANANGFSQRRRRNADPFIRLYAAEGEWTLTGANADHRLTLHPALTGTFALAVAAELEDGSAPSGLPEDAEKLAKICAADLKAHKGRALVTVGRRQPAAVHALCHWINGQLDAPVDYVPPADADETSDADNIRALADDLDRGHIESLIVIGANPAYDTPRYFGLAGKIAKVPFTAALSLHDDETAAQCQWRLPMSHPLESWSDLRAADGTASIVQPLIRPLYDTRGAHELLGFVAGRVWPSSYRIVRETWRDRAPSGQFEDWWRRTLHEGVVAGTAAKPVSPGAPQRPDLTSAERPQGVTLALSPDPSVWDGAYANNPWLQECPHPFTKDVWGNTVHMSSSDAKRHGLTDGDMVEISRGDIAVRGPIRIRERQAEGLIATTLGFGRRRAGAIGSGVGFNAYPLRTHDNPWLIESVNIEPTGERHEIPSLQQQFRLEGEAKDLYPTIRLSELAKGRHPPGHDEHHPSLYPDFEYDTYAWAMVIDTSVCIGCNACVVACQAENNVPVVGPDEIRRGRDMHWLRVDRYEPDVGQMPGFQPVPCMHCEKAPCEPVCPVEASVHDGEGLNAQIYNRCIGTRFCQATCPYKVRRFNFYGWADGQEYADLGAEVVKAAMNPDVTVRARGVMEKCTYCVQRISRARREAEKSDRPIADGEVVTACQAACPTHAIGFGDKNKKDSAVSKLKEEPHHYELLGHLGTRPRTTYLAYLRNPNPALEPEA